jgi:DNA modification methylase
MIHTQTKYYTIYNDSCLTVLDSLEPNSIDCIITDPPYEIGFMSKGWDNTGIAFNVDTWEKALRVLKHGGYLLAFNHSRTFHRMAVAIEDAGFEIRDTILYLYGSGFPKSSNVELHLDKLLEKCLEEITYVETEKTKSDTEYKLRPLWEAYLQEAEHITKEQWEVLQSCLSKQGSHPTMLWEEFKESTENGKESSVERWSYIQEIKRKLQGCKVCESTKRVCENGEERWLYNGTQTCDGETFKQDIKANRGSSSYRPQPSKQQIREPYVIFIKRKAQEIRSKAQNLKGYGSALKPAYEPIIMARKPIENTIAQNVLKWGVGAINIDECRVGTEERFNSPAKAKKHTFNCSFDNDYNGNTVNGRFPANVIHDGSDEVVSIFPDVGGSYRPGNRDSRNAMFDMGEKDKTNQGYNDNGSASRFFYCAKASAKDRDEGLDLDYSTVNDGRKKSIDNAFQRGETLRKNIHPTVKPTDLMQYLVRLVAPKGSIVLDPFMGSGSTGKAVMIENNERNADYHFIGIDLEKEYCDIAKARIEYGINYKENKAKEEESKIVDEGQTSIFDF